MHNAWLIVTTNRPQSNRSTQLEGVAAAGVGVGAGVGAGTAGRVGFNDY